MQNKWHDISEIEEFKEYYEFNEYVVSVGDEDWDYKDLVFGIESFPKGTKRFFCVPYDEHPPIN